MVPLFWTFYFALQYWGLTQGLALARRVLYDLSHTTSFIFGFFSISSPLHYPSFSLLLCFYFGHSGF
jgi:hypothetical protein